jgi:hypothetical protein
MQTLVGTRTSITRLMFRVFAPSWLISQPLQLGLRMMEAPAPVAASLLEEAPLKPRVRMPWRRRPVALREPERASSPNWVQWHEQVYASPRSRLWPRLVVVKALLLQAIDAQPEQDELQLLSLCAGDGRDVLPVLTVLRDERAFRTRLIERDPILAARARDTAGRSALRGVEVVCGDAACTDNYTGAVPADVVLACGIFGNIGDGEVRRTIDALPGICREGAFVIWTREPDVPDPTPTVRRWFAEAGFDEVVFVSPGRKRSTVGMHRLTGPSRPLPAGERLFTFA